VEHDGQIAGNKKIDAAIKHCLGLISPQDARRFLKKFREQPHDEPQVLHTFRELLLGAYLASHGQRVEHDRRVNGRTPDWCILHEDGDVAAIIELVNFHADRTREKDMEQRGSGGGVWVGMGIENAPRLYDRIQEKASAYKKLVESLGVPYVVGLFALFDAIVDLDEVRQCLFDDDGDAGLFGLHPQMSGVLFFEEAGGTYGFHYMPNPSPAREMDLPSGNFGPWLVPQ